MTLAQAHFVDSDIQGTSGLDSWTSNNYSFGAVDDTKIQISTAEELAKIGVDANYPLDGDYEVTANIDLSDYAEWTPIGTSTVNAFTGTFDGQYFTISNVTILKDGTGSDLGLFGFTSSAYIENLRITDINLSGYDDMGGLIGQLSGATEIYNCQVDGITITGAKSVAGYYHMADCGGLIGGLSGGITGYAINRCSVVNLNFRAEAFIGCGGILGRHLTGDYNNCYAQGTFTAWDYVTGASSYKAGGSYWVGGLVGDGIGSRAVTSYAAVTLPPAVAILNKFEFPSSIKQFGSLVGWKIYTYIDAGEDCYWDSDISNCEFDVRGAMEAGIDGKTTVEMYQEATFVDWDFTDTWEIDEGNDYPVHQWESAIDNPYQIKTGEQNRTTAMPTDYSHLNGQTVDIVTDGAVQDDQVVANGAVTGSPDHVGLNYVSMIKPTKLNVWNSGVLLTKKIVRSIVNFYQTLKGKVGTSETELETVSFDTDLFTGLKNVPLNDGYDRDGDIVIKQDEPLPMTVLGVELKLGVHLP